MTLPLLKNLELQDFPIAVPGNELFLYGRWQHGKSNLIG